MKNIVAFFLLFVTLTSLLPCSDEVTCNDEPISASLQISHQDNESDDCTSICVCACCGQRIVVVDQIRFVVQAPVHYPNHTIKTSQFYLEQLSNSIWQPPKLG